MIRRFWNSFTRLETAACIWLTAYNVPLLANKWALRITLLAFYTLFEILKYAYLFRFTLWLKAGLAKLLW